MSMFEKIISLENLFDAWTEFKKEKSNKKDVAAFEVSLEDHVFELHEDLKNGNYRHGGYYSFFVHDPKRRHIHKASVRDRLLHHAVYRILYPFFDKIFITHSFSCRNDKGTHRALNCFRKFVYKVSRNNTRVCWVLKCDIKKFFASIDQRKLFNRIMVCSNMVMLLRLGGNWRDSIGCGAENQI